MLSSAFLLRVAGFRHRPQIRIDIEHCSGKCFSAEASSSRFLRWPVLCLMHIAEAQGILRVGSWFIVGQRFLAVGDGGIEVGLFAFPASQGRSRRQAFIHVAPRIVVCAARFFFLRPTRNPHHVVVSTRSVELAVEVAQPQVGILVSVDSDIFAAQPREGFRRARVHCGSATPRCVNWMAARAGVDRLRIRFLHAIGLRLEIERHGRLDFVTLRDDVQLADCFVHTEAPKSEQRSLPRNSRALPDSPGHNDLDGAYQKRGFRFSAQSNSEL